MKKQRRAWGEAYDLADRAAHRATARTGVTYTVMPNYPWLKPLEPELAWHPVVAEAPVGRARDGAAD